MAEARAVPEGFRSVTPHLVVRGCQEAIGFYREAFGVEERMVMPGPGGEGVMYAELRIGDSLIMLGEEMPQMSDWVSPAALAGTSVAVHLYLEDVDAAFERAVAAGARVKMPPTDMFWGDRYSLVLDPFGHAWSLASHQRDLDPDEMAAAAGEFLAAAGQGGPPQGEGS